MTERYLILGAGRAGVSAAEALLDCVEPSRIRIWDAHVGPETATRTATLAEAGVAVELGDWRPEWLRDPTPSAVVKSPGIPATHPAVQAALTAGLDVLDELELGVRLGCSPLVAVTGTDGKSTVCALLARALESSGETVTVAGNTEFGPPLTGARGRAGQLVVEASSYQLEFCSGPFSRLAVLTNLTTEHLHRHGTMREYGWAKRRLFLGKQPVPLAVLNVDSPYGLRLAAELSSAGTTVRTFGTIADADYRVAGATWDVHRATIQIQTPRRSLELETRLPGWHNAENVAAALAACDLLGMSTDTSLPAVSSMAGVPGRWEAVDAGQEFDVIVDFAHTPAGLERLLTTARHVVERRPGARVRLVLCAAGTHNPAKRRPFGEIASRLADAVILTEGNGRGEPAAEVIAQIQQGWRDGGAEAIVVPDRRQAIRRALRSASSGDLVLIMGRGAMPTLYSNLAGGGRPFDDRVVARLELSQVTAHDQPVAARTQEVILPLNRGESKTGVKAD